MLHHFISVTSDSLITFTNFNQILSMSSFTSNPTKSYDVYLSFCAKDTTSFVSGIYKALASDAETVVFWDDERLESDDHVIASSTLNAIEDCKIAIIVFSKNYTNSIWCLKELEKITECCQRTTGGLIVLPFFYDGIYPSYESLQRNNYGGGFHHLVDKISMQEKTSSEDEDKFISWVTAITNQAFKYDVLDYIRDWHRYENCLI